MLNYFYISFYLFVHLQKVTGKLIKEMICETNYLCALWLVFYLMGICYKNILVQSFSNKNNLHSFSLIINGYLIYFISPSTTLIQM